VPSSFTAASVSDLVADINAANAAGGSNTINLVAGTTFNLTAVDNTSDGARPGGKKPQRNRRCRSGGSGDIIHNPRQ